MDDELISAVARNWFVLGLVIGGFLGILFSAAFQIY